MCGCKKRNKENQKIKEQFLSALDVSDKVLLSYNQKSQQTFTGPVSRKRYTVSMHNPTIYVDREDAREFLTYKKRGAAIFAIVEFEEATEEEVAEYQIGLDFGEENTINPENSTTWLYEGVNSETLEAEKITKTVIEDGQVVSATTVDKFDNELPEIETLKEEAVEVLEESVEKKSKSKKKE